MKRLNKIANTTFTFNELCENKKLYKAYKNAINSLYDSKEYMDAIAEEIDKTIRKMIGDYSFTWEYKNDEVYFSDDFESEVSDPEMQHRIYKAICDIIDFNNKTIEKAKFDLDGNFIGFI